MTVLEQLKRDEVLAKKKPASPLTKEEAKHLQDKMSSGAMKPVEVIDEKKRQAINRLPRLQVLKYKNVRHERQNKTIERERP